MIEADQCAPSGGASFAAPSGASSSGMIFLVATATTPTMATALAAISGEGHVAIVFALPSTASMPASVTTEVPAL